jgi:hypothetical protein
MIRFEDYFFKEAPIVDVVPGKFHGDENTPDRIKKYDPRPMFKRHTEKHGYRPHGEYYDKQSSEILTDDTYESGVVDCSNGRPSFRTSDNKTIYPNDIQTKIRGAKNYRTNLIRPVLYSWVEKPTSFPDDSFLITIEGGSSHLYCIKLEMLNSVKLARHIRKSKTPSGNVSYKEPSLRPMTFGNLDLGRVIGKIIIKSSGMEHSVYDKITVR